MPLFLCIQNWLSDYDMNQPDEKKHIFFSPFKIKSFEIIMGTCAVIRNNIK